MVTKFNIVNFLKIISIYIFICSISNCFSQNTDTLTFKRVDLRIQKELLIEATVRGKLLLINRDIHFLPNNRTGFARDIKISIDSITYIKNISFYFFWIVSKDGCKYKIGFNGKRKLFRKIDSLTNRELIFKRVKHLTNKSASEKGNVKVKIPYTGSTIFTPIWVNIEIENNKNYIVLNPIDYPCFLKPVYIYKNEIKKVKKTSKNYSVIVLLSGLKYKIKGNSGEKLFEGY